MESDRPEAILSPAGALRASKTLARFVEPKGSHPNSHTGNKKGANRPLLLLLAERVGLIRIASGRSSPLRGALRASKTLTRFVEPVGSHPSPPSGK